MEKRKLALWFYRFTSVHFLVTAATGLALYFRPGDGRPAWFSDDVKEILVKIHNGEWLTALLLDRPFWSGITIGAALTFALARFSWRSLRRNDPDPS